MFCQKKNFFFDASYYNNITFINKINIYSGFKMKIFSKKIKLAKVFSV